VSSPSLRCWCSGWAALCCCAGHIGASHADLSPYSQDFESLAPAAAFPGGNDALSADGWLAFASVYTAGGAPLYTYDPLAVPNSLGAFSAVGYGGSQPGNQNMGVFSDYNNSGAHGSGQLVQASVFQQRTVGVGDVGTNWTFQFDAKLFTLVAPSTALAFIQTLDPANGYQVSGQRLIDMSAVPAVWGTYSLPFTITAGAGQILQFGFSNTATNYNGSAIVYDNISLTPVTEPSPCAMMLAGLGVLGLAARRRSL
jgi:hypothetical protein